MNENDFYVHFWERSLLKGAVRIKYMVEDRGETATTRYKHYIIVTVAGYGLYSWTLRSPYSYGEDMPYFTEEAQLKADEEFDKLYKKD